MPIADRDDAERQADPEPAGGQLPGEGRSGNGEERQQERQARVGLAGDVDGGTIDGLVHGDRLSPRA
jgi:hypothetical protein